jgi:glutamate---cysteine ligase / carboxylate-amine ligase
MYVPPLTLGVEEEYQIIDPETRKLTSFVQQMLEDGKIVLGDQVTGEFMQSQIEVGSHICRNVAEAREEVVRLRHSVHDLAKEHGRLIAAASTHPFSRWDEQRINEGDRYKDLETDMQYVGRRLLIFGMHVHIGFGKSPEALELLIDIQNQMRYFLPHILALSTSSPFWHGRDTGLKSYRSIVFENLPRSGITPTFDSYSEYEDMVHIFGKMGSLGKDSSGISNDSTKLWWDVRPQPRFGTMEIRVSDICTKVDEAVALVALIQALAAKLVKLRQNNMSWRIYPTALVRENKWRAVRYGINGKLLDLGKTEEVPFRFLVKELLEFVDDVLDDLGSRKDVEYIKTIVEEGTSADRQVAMYRKAIKEGQTHEDAMRLVVDQLIEETHEGWKVKKP